MRALFASQFADHPGEMGLLWIPFDHAGADAWLQRLLQERLDGFGPFEDALSPCRSPRWRGSCAS